MLSKKNLRRAEKLAAVSVTDPQNYPQLVWRALQDGLGAFTLLGQTASHAESFPH